MSYSWTFFHRRAAAMYFPAAILGSALYILSHESFNGLTALGALTASAAVVAASIDYQKTSRCGG